METLNSQRLKQQAEATELAPYIDQLIAMSEKIWQEKKHGKIPIWQKVISQLPDVDIKGNIDIASVGAGGSQLTEHVQAQLKEQLFNMRPWRKGPFELGGMHLDTEWRSDWKWDRVLPHITPLKDRVVLDIGCGSGYHAWRMAGEQAKLVIGIEPMQLFHYQFATVRHFVGDQYPVHLLPFRIEQLSDDMPVFDTVFSMGVLYHQRSPIDHILSLKSLLQHGGEVVLETLVIPGEDNNVLVPTDRYAQMRNVWFIPTVQQLSRWLQRCGFIDIKVADINQTSISEQRATEWMIFESLSNWLDQDNPDLTVEGYSAPLRATLIATKK